MEILQQQQVGICRKFCACQPGALIATGYGLYVSRRRSRICIVCQKENGVCASRFRYARCVEQFRVLEPQSRRTVCCMYVVGEMALLQTAGLPINCISTKNYFANKPRGSVKIPDQHLKYLKNTHSMVVCTLSFVAFCGFMFDTSSNN